MISGNETLYAPNFALTRLGYQCIKWALDDDRYDGIATSNNSLPMYRYAEVLLNYAEAKAELGEMNETVWNKTIKPLRERAGVVGAVPQSYDPYLASYYLNQTTDKWILEVRRERSIELALEMVRPDDLMRWKLGDLFTSRWYGIYIPEKNVAYDLNNDGTPDVAVVDEYPETTVPGVVYIELDNSYRLSEGDHGYIEYGFNLGRLWQNRKYLRPIPTKAIQVNPNLLPQNPGWE
ncbi:RagB/SusD family nutrient uptake outer membrane protein [Draconibacterium orientale]|uniref:RagB/SusD family nutrient uptake outer membrane protein n=1 Tax=Draconibacterium orientale TaxID=1168034 RepID=UPI002ABE5D5A|nr:RagB/SusD family nutrient uptake outer membrane protein [Draconibacterium orientale]